MLQKFNLDNVVKHLLKPMQISHKETNAHCVHLKSKVSTFNSNASPFMFKIK